MSKKIIEFPIVFNSADKVSLAAQKEYILLIKLQLSFLLITTIISTFIGLYRGLLIIVAISMVGSLFVTSLIRIRKKERFWFDGRALAESIKTLCWRYMMGADPFKITLPDEKVDRLFNESVKNVLQERKSLSSTLVSKSKNQMYITTAMKEIRSLDFRQRIELYLQYRVQNQQNWYSDKCEYNRKRENWLFNTSFLLQILAIVYIIILINQNWTVNITGILSALATVTITWLQVKQHQELAQAYGLAAQELNFIYSMSFDVQSEESLSDYVNETENAISREHTLWVARRGQ
jgi:SMODS and SLOG-associating 2TM effector domain 3/SMODS and SLOG-associating 2TM effector domain 1